MTVWDDDELRALLQRFGKALHAEFDQTATEPLPQDLLNLVQFLSEVEVLTELEGGGRGAAMSDLGTIAGGRKVPGSV